MTRTHRADRVLNRANRRGVVVDTDETGNVRVRAVRRPGRATIRAAAITASTYAWN